VKQQNLTFTTHGGPRKGAGRKPKGGRAGEKHLRRPRLDGRSPVHVTLRVARGLPNLRAQRCIAVVRRAFHEGRERFGFRLVQYAVQADHVHLIVEAARSAEQPAHAALSRGVKGLCIRIARHLNAELGRAGKVFADRYHARALGTPREVRRALAYVLLQQRRHAAKRRVGMTTMRDPCSSAFLFDGFSRGAPPSRAGGATPRAPRWLTRSARNQGAGSSERRCLARSAASVPSEGAVSARWYAARAAAVSPRRS
jgi:REP-associated tyrosine transposase